MTILFGGYEVVLCICCIITLAMAIYSYTHKKGALSKSLSKLALSSFFFSFVFLLAVLINDLEISFFLMSLQFAIFTAACSIWVVFIFKFLKINKNKFEKYIWLTYIFPIILIIASFINIFKPVLFKGINLLSVQIGPLSYAVYVYTLTLTVLALFILILYYNNRNIRDKKSILIMFILPLCTSLPSFITFGSSFYEFSITSITFSIAIMFLFICLYLTNLMDITPNIDKKNN